MPSGFNPVGVTSVAGKTGAVVVRTSDIVKVSSGSTVISGSGSAFGENNYTSVLATPFSFVLRGSNGSSAIACPSGLTAARPTADSVPVGYIFLNLTTGELNISNGVAWINAFGALAA